MRFSDEETNLLFFIQLSTYFFVRNTLIIHVQAGKGPTNGLTEMLARIAQVARLSLGVAQPLMCFHWKDVEFPDFAEALGSRVASKYDKATRQKFQGRGWANLGKRQGEEVGQQSNRLSKDLLNTEATTYLLAVASGGVDAADGYYSLKWARDERQNSKHGGFQEQLGRGKWWSLEWLFQQNFRNDSVLSD